MALPVTIPNEFANAATSIPLSQLDVNFSTLANAINGISDGSETLANVTATIINATTIDTTNIEVTNIKAKDGTAAASIADSTGKITVATELAVDNLNFSGNAITSTDTDGDIDLTPDGTGEVNISKVDIAGGEIDAVTLGTNSPVTEAQIDNINIDGNTISTTDTDGDLILSPDGDGVTQEEVGGTNYNLASQYDIGTAPNEIPLNQYLGDVAYLDSNGFVIQPQASAVPAGIGDMVFQLTSNTSLEIKVKGSDGTVRSVALTLA